MQFMNREGKSLLFNDWCALQNSRSYSNVDLTRVGNAIVLTEWLGISNAPFRTRTIWLSTESEDRMLYSGSEKMARAQHKQVVKYLIQKQPDYNSHAAKETCVLCGSPMQLKTGKHGTFFSCTAWHKTKCPCTVSNKGGLSQKTKEALDKLMKKAQTIEDADPFEDRLDHIELA